MDSKAPEGSEPAITDNEAYAALANATSPRDAMGRLRERFLAVPTLIEAKKGLCETVDKKWFSDAWWSAKGEFGRYKCAFTLTKHATER